MVSPNQLTCGWDHAKSAGGTNRYGARMAVEMLVLFAPNSPMPKRKLSANTLKDSNVTGGSGGVPTQQDELGIGKDGERWRDNQGDVWEWRTNRWVCGRWTLYPTDDSVEFGPFKAVL